MSDESFYWVVAHATIEKDLKSLAARNWWSAAYRYWREHKRGSEEMDPVAVLREYHPRHGMVGAVLGMEFRL